VDECKPLPRTHPEDLRVGRRRAQPGWSLAALALAAAAAADSSRFSRGLPAAAAAAFGVGAVGAPLAICLGTPAAVTPAPAPAPAPAAPAPALSVSCVPTSVPSSMVSTPTPAPTRTPTSAPTPIPVPVPISSLIFLCALVCRGRPPPRRRRLERLDLTLKVRQRMVRRVVATQVELKATFGSASSQVSFKRRKQTRVQLGF